MAELSELAHEVHVDELKRLHDAALRLIESFIGWHVLFKTQVSLLRDESPGGEVSLEEVATGRFAQYGRRLLLDALQVAHRVGLFTVLDLHCGNNLLPNFGSELYIMEANLANDIEAGAYTFGNYVPQMIAEGLLSVLSALSDFELLQDLLSDRDGAFLRDRIAKIQKGYDEAINKGG
jgi:hypothetical protein